MRLAHVGIVVSAYQRGIEEGIALYERLGYKLTFRIRRSEPWIGEIVGIPGADIDIAHLKQDGSPVGIELLAYHSASQPRPSYHHLAFEVESIEETEKRFLEMRWSMCFGKATIPDGPNAGTICGYYDVAPDCVIELIQKPQKPEPERTIDAIQEVRALNNDRWMDVVRLAMRVAPEEARAIFSEIEENDRKIYDLSSHMRTK